MNEAIVVENLKTVTGWTSHIWLYIVVIVVIDVVVMLWTNQVFKNAVSE